MGGACSTYGAEDARFWLGNLGERNHLEDTGVDGKIMLRWIFRKRDGAWTGLIWLWIETGVGLL